MKKSAKIKKHKLGTEAHDDAKRPNLIDPNFKQSKDIHEDRGTIQRLANPEGVIPRQRPRK